MFKSTSLKAVRDGTLWQAQCKACVDLHVSIFFFTYIDMLCSDDVSWNKFNAKKVEMG